jgi:hypothetical protein
MNDELPNHYTINMNTHYTVQFKDANCTWVGQVNGKVKYHTSIASAEDAIKETFSNVYQHHVEEATIIEWKKTPIAVKKNNKRSMESTACYYDVEIYNTTCLTDVRPLWKVRRSNFESLEEAREYVKDRSEVDWSNTFRIVKREMTSKHSVVE